MRLESLQITTREKEVENMQVPLVRPEQYSDKVALLSDIYDDKVYFHPRTGAKDSLCTASCKGHEMPQTAKLHTNGCPRTTYHRQVNAKQILEKGIWKTVPTAQLKTFWGERKHGYSSKHTHAKHGGGRFTPPMPNHAPSRISGMVRHIKVA